MTPVQFLARIQKGNLAPAYLFLGSELYEARRCRKALIEAAVPAANRENGVVRFDLSDTPLAAIVDDARSFSLFASERLIVVTNAEAVLPRRMEEDSDTDGATPGSAENLDAYIADPSPGVVLLFEATRFDFDGEEKKKLDRVRKFYSSVANVVELRRASAEDARIEMQAIAKRAGIRLTPGAVGLLTEALNADLARIATEIEKLTLYMGESGKPVDAEEIAALVPDARVTTIFTLVGALGRRDRARALELLNTLLQEGEYLPLALTFLSGQFRMALVAKEAGLRSPQQIMGHFSKMGVPMWPSRAEQVCQTVSRFSREQLERSMRLAFEADRDLRDARPDDRVVMEKFVVDVTA
jgi:DNA polymerase-3 subunit delta